jgi:hypothetical protein
MSHNENDREDIVSQASDESKTDDRIPTTIPAPPSAGSVDPRRLSGEQALRLRYLTARFEATCQIIAWLPEGHEIRVAAQAMLLGIVDEFLDQFGEPVWAGPGETCDHRHPAPPCQAEECYRDRICPTCAGEGSMKDGTDVDTCLTCHGRGTVDCGSILN